MWCPLLQCDLRRLISIVISPRSDRGQPSVIIPNVHPVVLRVTIFVADASRPPCVPLDVMRNGTHCNPLEHMEVSDAKREDKKGVPSTIGSRRSAGGRYQEMAAFVSNSSSALSPQRRRILTQIQRRVR